MNQPAMNQNSTSIPLIGIVGGIASGKSEVSRRFQALGAACLQADQIVHELFQRPDIIESVRLLMGSMAVTESGEVDRKYIASRIFGSHESADQDRRELERLLHPLVREEIEKQVIDLRSRNQASLIVLDAPLLLEAGYQSMCQAIVFIDTPDHLRQQFAARRGWTREQLKEREAAQLPLVRKAAEADYVIDNHGDLEHLQEQVDALYAILRQS